MELENAQFMIFLFGLSVHKNVFKATINQPSAKFNFSGGYILTGDLTREKVEL